MISEYKSFWLVLIVLITSGSIVFGKNNYKGKPWNNNIQQIPGKVQCEFYDIGGEGVAFHDSDSINEGSGKLNPVNGFFLNEFRLNESVDISYTKSNETDNNPYNKVEPLMNQLYVGWTVPGEWLNYTVNVQKTGIYSVGLMYTANGDGQISLEIDNKDLTGVLTVPSTKNDNDPLNWRQWHHWNRIDDLKEVRIVKGIHVVKLKTVANGNMNYDYIIFSLVK